MKKTFLYLAASSLLFLSACATQPQGPDPVLVKLDDLESRLARVERVLNNQSLLELQNDNDDLEGQVQSLRNQIETLTYGINNAGDRQKSQYVDLDNRLQQLEARPTTRVVTAGPSTLGSAGTPVVTASGNERQLYQGAFDLLKAAKYKDAANGFEGYLTSYPDGQLADNAYYWLGESHYIQRDFQTALNAFGTVTQNYPSSRKIADAWLKVGYCYYELGAMDEAKAALSKTIQSFPDSSAARLAQQRLDRINKS